MDMGGMTADNSTASASFCSGSGTVMMNGYQSSENGYCVLYLFQNAVVDTRVKYAFALLGSMWLGMAVELLRVARTVLARRLEGKVPNIVADLLEGLLYAVQMMVAYWLMLLVMLYEYGIFIFILLGLGLGRLCSRRIERACLESTACTCKDKEATGCHCKASQAGKLPYLLAEGGSPCCGDSSIPKTREHSI
eukprot:m.222472 g.222472  ORF g.222472 m.222472 type:complete len:193 (-) comp10768_c0_seq1:203-781(-)